MRRISSLLYLRDSIAGTKPFKSFSSIVGISAFILITSQFLGNVPVIQLAKPNVVYLDDESKRLAWAIISFVATVGGNLTITGSAGEMMLSRCNACSRIDDHLTIPPSSICLLGLQRTSSSLRRPLAWTSPCRWTSSSTTRYASGSPY